MTLEQYRQETLRTLPDLGSLVLNSIHMSSGIVTEISELTDAWRSDDDSSTIDEQGDALWYVSNYAYLHQIELNDVHTVGTPYDMLFCGAKLLDFDKKALAYGKPYNREEQIFNLNELYSLISCTITTIGGNIEDVFDKNIAKLRIRFPEKFSGDQAINKDVAKEKEVFN